jgi:3-deoxy-manno-octulosonate cytidylyltransferase (CMP-KDO synthetase)
VKIHVLIPARLESTRFPKKMLADLFGKPLIVRTAEQVQTAFPQLSIYIATDSDAIAQAIPRPFNVIRTPADCPSGTDRIFKAACTLSPRDEDLIINVQGDEPLIPLEVLRGTLDILQNSNADMATAGSPFGKATDLELESYVKVLSTLPTKVNPEPIALDFRRTIPKDWSNRFQEHQTEILHHIGIYGFRFESLNRFCKTPPTQRETAEKLEQLRAVELGFKIGIFKHRVPAPPGVDRPEDLEYILSEFKQKAHL